MSENSDVHVEAQALEYIGKHISTHKKEAETVTVLWQEMVKLDLGIGLLQISNPFYEKLRCTEHYQMGK